MPRSYVRKNPPRYAVEELACAVNDIKNGRMTYREAVEAYGIPLGVLHNRVNGKIDVDKIGAGRPTDISTEVEQKLAKCLIARARMGFPCDKEELKSLVQEFVLANGLHVRFKYGKPGEDWYIGFMKRHSNLSLKKPELLQKARKKARDPFVVYHFYDAAKELYEKHSVDADSGCFIFNADESGFPNDPSRMRAVGEKGKALSRVSDGSGRENTTVLACISAGGHVLPPLIVHKGKAVQERWVSAEAYQGTMYAATSNGWMEEPTFFFWFTEIQ
ncbi:Hypothetical protein NTJ_05218 [Nesidiocoris tenuis]|uniref:HTH psq-type domain-containing protein n=1 Tax=Nesidiocoris tenuis TaxID=355587 RepID=A0ABN7AJJ3_9HEMI|nr:Hypothetical protein NTJ_05218 [Nesidiocoris tenuis]